ncbi:MAG: ABC transporter permease [Betaproteobacteria bacterium]|nr:MAG: ABC transporter permease [Betaproteobacteria bacterium]
MADAPSRQTQPERALGTLVGGVRRRIDPAIAWAFGCIVLVLLVGSLYSSSFLSPQYLLQQLKVASFLGVIATGAMIVILLGQIDLSVPWVVAAGGMMATAATGWGPVGEVLAIPVGVGSGIALGLISGVGVAFLRIPSMVVTLAMNAVAQGLMIVHTGGFSPQDASSQAMRFIATGETVLGIPNAVLVWAAVGVAAVFLLTRTTFGRTVYAIGNRERAAYLSGARTRLVMMAAFGLAGGLSAFGGVLLAGYASKAAQAMGDPYLLPAIAAVVLGGTSILGGRGSYLGTVAGVILITLLQSILSVMQMPEFGRHVTYGVVIVAMLLIYGRGRRYSD